MTRRFDFVPNGPPSVDHEAMRLPVEIVLREVCELGDAHAGIEKRPHNQFFFIGVTNGGQTVRLVRRSMVPV